MSVKKAGNVDSFCIKRIARLISKAHPWYDDDPPVFSDTITLEIQIKEPGYKESGWCDDYEYDNTSEMLCVHLGQICKKNKKLCDIEYFVKDHDLKLLEVENPIEDYFQINDFHYSGKYNSYECIKPEYLKDKKKEEILYEEFPLSYSNVNLYFNSDDVNYRKNKHDYDFYRTEDKIKHIINKITEEINRFKKKKNYFIDNNNNKYYDFYKKKYYNVGKFLINNGNDDLFIL